MNGQSRDFSGWQVVGAEGPGNWARSPEKCVERANGEKRNKSWGRGAEELGPEPKKMRRVSQQREAEQELGQSGQGIGPGAQRNTLSKPTE